LAERRAATKERRRKPGKQQGSPGSTLCRRDPDREVVHRPTTCRGCGAPLDEAPVVGGARRQVLEIPEPRIEATDHVAERRRCSCGCETVAPFPPQATGPVVWGPRAKAAAAYLLARQHIPLERASEAMAVLFDAPMGEGTLAGLLPDAAGRLGGFMDRVRSLLGGCPVVHADETPVRVGVASGWVHTVCTPGLTFLAYQGFGPNTRESGNKRPRSSKARAVPMPRGLKPGRTPGLRPPLPPGRTPRRDSAARP
ncbi:MAG: IS66 family transposase, partial [Actinomycetota bacterium]